MSSYSVQVIVVPFQLSSVLFNNVNKLEEANVSVYNVQLCIHATCIFMLDISGNRLIWHNAPYTHRKKIELCIHLLCLYACRS